MFSETVDKITTSIGRISKRPDIVRYLNATIQECQNQAYFARDLLEDSITSSGASPQIWDCPVGFRLMRGVDYPNYGPVDNMPPGRIQSGKDAYYYRAAGYFVFKGADAEDEIHVAYYNYSKKLSYYEDGTRPAVYDPITYTWSYLENGAYVPTLGSDDLDEAARLLVTNWLLDDFEPTVTEGTLAKTMLAVDDARGPKHYAVYQALKKLILQAENFESLNT